MSTALLIAAILAAPLYPGALIILGMILWAICIYRPSDGR